jgi:hypothetical protein
MDDLDDYWDREFDEDSDDEYDAIKDWGLMTGQSYESVARQRRAGTLGRRTARNDIPAEDEDAPDALALWYDTSAELM